MLMTESYDVAVSPVGSVCSGTLEKQNFKSFLNQIAERFPSRAALAKRLGITPSRLSRALNTGDFPLNVENCLRLAKVSGEPPSDVLRAAGKGDVVDLIESLYGAKSEFTWDERELLNEWRSLNERARMSLRTLVADLARAEKSAKRKTA
jgi:transcriptional regulator with XRE-family HTH domain